MYKVTFNRLNQLGFRELKEHTMDGLAWFKDEIVDVFLQQWDETISLETILDECQRSREMIMKMGGNPWNSYYLLCADNDDLEEQNVYLIEHNSLAMRKYVIRSEYDLKRIPFLDMLNVVENIEANRMNIVNGSVSGTAMKFIEYLIENDGANVRFKKDEVISAINNVLDLTGGDTE